MIQTCLFIAVLSAANPNVAEPPPPPPAPPPQVQAPQADPLPGARAFGIRAGLGGGSVGSVGAKFFLTDMLVLRVDIGLGLTTGNGASSANFQSEALLGIFLRNRGASLRPYIPIVFGVGFGTRTTQQLMQIGNTLYPVTTQQGGFSLEAGAGIGAEYWFSSYFSVAADLLFRISATNLDPFTIQIGTLTPGIHATYWF